MIDHVLAETIKDLIDTNKSSLVTGLYAQGQACEIKQLTLSPITPPTEFYYVSVNITDAEEVKENNVDVAYYKAEIKLGEYAVMQPSDVQAFEEITQSFREFGNRVVKLIREQTRFTHTETGTKFTVRIDGTSGKRIRKINREVVEPLDNSFQSMLASVIQFEVMQRCGLNEGL